MALRRCRSTVLAVDSSLHLEGIAGFERLGGVEQAELRKGGAAAPPAAHPPDVESTPTQAEACKREEAELALAQPAKGTVTRAKGKVCWRFDTLGTYYYSTRVEWVDRGGMVG